jgi:hypothetical protein
MINRVMVLEFHEPRLESSIDERSMSGESITFSIEGCRELEYETSNSEGD